MKPELLPLLLCPNCRAELKENAASLECASCLRSYPLQAGIPLFSQPPAAKEEIDPAFINDQYWLLFPLHLSWDHDAKVEDTGAHKLPLGKGSAGRLLVTYPSQGGYTPGDAYELFVGADNHIQEWIYRRGGSAKPTLVATWTDYKKAGPLLVAMDHRGTYQGKPARIFFTNVSVKLAGSSTWSDAH